MISSVPVRCIVPAKLDIVISNLAGTIQVNQSLMSKFQVGLANQRGSYIMS